MRYLRKFARIYLIPAAVFQSVLVGGGYGTGREVVEYFTQFGVLEGLLGIAVATGCFFVIITITFHYCIRYQLYDYRSFFQSLLGRYWVAFEFFFLLLLLLVLAVVAAASGDILHDVLGIPNLIGNLAMMIAVTALIFLGRDAVSNVLTFWSILLYAMIGVILFITLPRGFVSVEAAFAPTLENGDWFSSGLRFALYSVAVLPAVLFSLRGIETRQQATKAALFAAAFGMVPAVVLHIAFAGYYPDIVNETVPLFWVLQEQAIPWLVIGYMIILFGTFIETGAGFIQGVVERYDAYVNSKAKRTPTKYQHVCLSIALVAVSLLVSQIGIIDLIARGYSAIAYGILITYVVPLLTVGVYRLYFEK